MFDRSEINNINTCSMLICGYTLGFIRFYGFVFTCIFIWLFLRLVLICYNPNKAMSRCRSFLVKIVSAVLFRIILFFMGYIWI